MDLLVLGLLAVLALPVGVIVLFVRMAGLQARLTRLERDLALLRQGQADRAAADPSAPRVAGADPVIPPAPPAAADMPAPPPPPPTPPGADPLARLWPWLRDNWVYVVSGVSLALAGVFLVQYGVENGLLPPWLRVLCGLCFGLALVTVGEGLQRRFGDAPTDATAYLPGVFSGAGVVAVFAALLAARQIYGLIGPEAAFAGLVATAAGAIVLGWFNGPFMVALGLSGAMAAPFLVGGRAEAADAIYAYFAILAALGLTVDAVRRWAWVSVLALALGFVGGWLLHQAGGGAAGWALLCAGLVPLSVALPALRLIPDHAGPTCLTWSLQGAAARPIFPVRLAAGTLLTATLFLTLAEGAMLPLALLAVLAVLLALWTNRAEGLHDLALLPAVGFWLRLAHEGLSPGPLADAFAAPLPPEGAPLPSVTIAMALGLAMSLAFAWRARRGSSHPFVLAAAGALAAPVTVLLLDLFWPASAVLGAFPWALHVIGTGAVMTALALRMAKAGERRQAAYYVLAALSLVALALFLLASAAALTLALAVLVVVAADLDRRFDLPEMGWFVQAGVLVIGYRLTFDPGLEDAVNAPWLPVLLGHLGPLAGFAAALWRLGGIADTRARRAARALLESGFAGTAAILADVVLFRLLDTAAPYLRLALLAYPWLVLALVQLYRAKLAGWLRWLRLTLALVAGLAALGATLAATTAFNPLIWGGRVPGPPILDSLLFSYALPGVTLLLALRGLGHLHRLLRLALASAGAALLALYAALEIRRFWRGDDLSLPGTTQPELYSYTLALLLLGAVLLWQAIAKASIGLRRLAMAVIAVTAAKVFLVDASGLTGLMRVFSFLALGLSLAGLAWLNRWAANRMATDR